MSSRWDAVCVGVCAHVTVVCVLLWWQSHSRKAHSDSEGGAAVASATGVSPPTSPPPRPEERPKPIDSVSASAPSDGGLPTSPFFPSETVTSLPLPHEGFDRVAHALAVDCGEGVDFIAPSPPRRRDPHDYEGRDGPAESEPSRYGKFVGTGCALSFRRTAPLLSKEEELYEPFNGPADDGPICKPLPALHVGGLRFPMVTSDGTEFHIFTAQCCGGSGRSVDSRVVVLTPSSVWTTPDLTDSEAPAIRTASLVRGRLTLEDRPGTTRFGHLFGISDGTFDYTQLPKLPSHVVSQFTHTFKGHIGYGSHFFCGGNFPVVMTVEHDVFAVDPGPTCDLEHAADDHGEVAMTANMARWSDGRKTVTCDREVLTRRSSWRALRPSPMIDS